MSNISQINGLNINAETASYALFAATVSGSVTNAVSASYASVAQTLLGSVVSASYAATASYSLTAQTLLGSVVSASYAATASLAPNYVLNSATSSFVTSAQTSSFVTTSQTSSFITSAQTSSFVTTSQTSSMSVASATSALTASYVDGNIFTSTNPVTSASYALSASWAPSAGGGTPGGNSNEVQYNNGAGGFAGAANVEISAEGNLNLIAQSDPATPAAGVLALYSKTIAGRTVPKVKGPSGLDYPLQSALWQNANYIWITTGATAGLWLNTAGAGAGTFSSALPTTSGGNAYTVQKRSRYANVVTTANQVLGQRNSDLIFFRGASAGQGGFFFYTRCGFDVWTNGGRFFAGMAPSNAVASADPSSVNNSVGFAVDAADNGIISFLTRGTAATKQSTGLTITSGKGYDIFIFCKPNDTSISYRIVDLITGTEYSNSATLTLPTNTTTLSANVLASNAALTTATAIQIGVSKIYIETDY